jgi:hypothetical protein
MIRRRLTHKRRPKHSAVKQRSNGLEMEVVQFPITNEQLLRIQRTVVRPRDCVINAMEIIGIIDGRSADIMRIMVGDLGIPTEKIENIFEFSFRRSFTFTPDNRMDLLDFFLTNSLMPNNIVFIGVEYISGEKHVFLIGKTETNALIYIDPQAPSSMCDLRETACFQTVFQNVINYYILQVNIASPLQVADRWSTMVDE